MLSYRQQGDTAPPLPRERRRTWHPPPLPGTAAHPTFPACGPSSPSPDPEPDGLVSVGSLLRREGRRAAHAVDRPLVPRARDLLEAGARTSTHRAAVAAGALLAVTTVLGSNALGDGTIISGVGVDEAADAGPAAVPPPAEPLPLAAADAPVRQVMAALQSAGTPVRAALVDGPIGTGLPGSGTVSGAGIVAAALGAPAVDQGGTTRSGSSSSDDDGGADDRSAASRSDDTRRDSDRDSSRDSSRDSDRDDRGSGSDDGAPSRPVVPLPSANPDLPPPVTGSDIVDGSLGGSGSAPDGNTDGGGSDSGSVGESDGDTAGDSDSPPSADGEDTGGDSRTPADGEEQDAGGDDSSASRHLLGRHRVGRRHVLGRHLLRRQSSYGPRRQLLERQLLERHRVGRRHRLTGDRQAILSSRSLERRGTPRRSTPRNECPVCSAG